MTEEIWLIFIREVESLEIFKLMGPFPQKHIML